MSVISIDVVYLRVSSVFFEACSAVLVSLSNKRDYEAPLEPAAERSVMFFNASERESLVQSAHYAQTLADMAAWVLARTENVIDYCMAGWLSEQGRSDALTLADRSAPPEHPDFAQRNLGPAPRLGDLVDRARELFDAGTEALRAAGDSPSLRAMLSNAEMLKRWLTDAE